jgi:hypothetical protein
VNNNLLNSTIQEYINNHLDSDTTTLILKGTSFNDVDTKGIIEQIEAKKRCSHKLPTWYNTKNIYYPNKLNIEQTSSEMTAQYKSKLISGNSILDLTGGFGVDCFYFSKHFKNVVHCELNKTLSKIVKYNYQQIDVRNIETQNVDGLNFLSKNNKHFDWIYIDPSRRHDDKGKVFILKDCLPNIPENLKHIFEHSDNILIKTSPLLDISKGIEELEFVKFIHVVAVNNEVKELLWILEKNFNQNIHIDTINILNDGHVTFNFDLNEEKTCNVKYSLPLLYLYEPNTAILKSGGFNIVGEKKDVLKIHKHSHLYTSANLTSFPGRRFRINQVIPFNLKALKKLSIKKANITTRNFPETVQQLRKKSGIKDGGNLYLFFSTDMNNNKIIIIASKVLS